MSEIISTRAGYVVPSVTHDGYWVIVDGATCTCPSGRAGLPFCRHRTAVAALVREQDRAAKRPDAPPAISMLVD